MKNSLQYRRVDKAIITAFIELARDNPFEKITVQDILEEALVSRYTFYKHFHDKYEIAERIQEELYQEFLFFIQKKVPELDAKNISVKDHHQLFDFETAQFTKKNETKLQAIKNIRTETIDFYRLMRTYFMDHYMESYPDRADAKLEAKIYANMVEAVMDYYVEYSHTLSSNINESVTNAHIRACLYGIGVHQEEKIQKVQEFLAELIFGNR